MIHVTFLMSYPPEQGEDNQPISFALWSGYGVQTAVEASALLRTCITAADPFEVRDSTGTTWRFWRDTVRGVAVTIDE